MFLRSLMGSEMLCLSVKNEFFIQYTHICMMCNTTTQQNIPTGIYFGDRGKEFRRFIKCFLKKTLVPKDKRKILLNADGMKVYGDAFTSDLVSPDNYQVYEQIGDVVAGHALVQIFYKKFPQLRCSEGVKVVARLKINYGATKSFFGIARDLGFWKFISAPVELRQHKMKSLLEDVFEAFLGATETIIDSHFPQEGYKIVYSILEHIFNNIKISLCYEDLYDSKTRLKETFDSNTHIGTLKYIESAKGEEQSRLVLSEVWRCCGPQKELLGVGTSSLKQDAQQMAATNALIYLNKKGISKKIPKIYQQFNDGKNIDDINDDELIKPEWIEEGKFDIDKLQFVNKKNKYHTTYQCTPLSYHCKKLSTKGIEECLKRGAKSNIEDTDGMYPLDIVFSTPNIDTRLANNIITLFAEADSDMAIHAQTVPLLKKVGINNVRKFRIIHSQQI